MEQTINGLNMFEFLKEKLSFNDPNYHTDGNIHYSILKAVDYDIRELNPDKSTAINEAMNLGTAFDMAMEDIELFKKTYYARGIQKPTYTLGELAEAVLLYDTDILDVDAVTKLCDTQSFWKTIKNNRAEALNEKWNTPEFHNYILQERRLSKVPQDMILDFSQYNDIIIKTKLLKSHIIRSLTESDNYKIIYQPIYRYTLSLDVSIKFDMLLIDCDSFIIYPIDTKYYVSGKNVYNWLYQFYTFRYDIQEALYTMGAKDLLEAYNEKYPEETVKWVIAQFRFAIACPNDDRVTLFNAPVGLAELTMNGYTTPYGKKVKGVYQLIDDYQVQKSIGEFTHPIEHYYNNGSIDLELPLTNKTYVKANETESVSSIS